MALPSWSYDVVIVGGGIAGSCLAGLLARAGLGVLVAEKEARFRDRVRGESTYPYGVAHAIATGLGDVLERAGAVPLSGLQYYENQQPTERLSWLPSSVDGRLEVGFSHPGLQETAFTWAAEQGATMLRPAKAIGYTDQGGPSVTVDVGGREQTFRARIVVGADGKHSMARRWTGGASASDPEHHRFGGVLVEGVQSDDRDTDNIAWRPGAIVNWFAAGPNHTRIYLLLHAADVRRLGADRSFDAFAGYAARSMPAGALAEARQAGPIGFFGNNDTWATRVSGNCVVLVGDAAGAPDPSHGHGTPMLFRDVRDLAESLLGDHDWDRAGAAYANRRETSFAAVRAFDRWNLVLDMEAGAAADRARERQDRARQNDPTLGGWALIEARGPEGLVPDEAARRTYLGEA